MTKCKYCNSAKYPLGIDGICTDCARCGVTVATIVEEDQDELDNLMIVQETLASLQTGDYLMVVPNRDKVEIDPEPYMYLVRVIGRTADGEVSFEKYSHKHPWWTPITIEQIGSAYCVAIPQIADAYLSGKTFEAALEEYKEV